MVKGAFAAVVCAVMVAGCDQSGTIFKQLDINDGVGVSLDARQRTVLVKEKGGPNKSRRDIVCSEPSPDAIVAAASAVAANVAVRGGGQNPGAGGGGFSRSFAETMASIGLRTQTIQLLRDQLFRACEAYMNGAIGRFQYNAIVNNMDRVIVSTLAVDGLAASPVAPAAGIGANANANVPPVNINPDGGVAAGDGQVAANAGAIQPRFHNAIINPPPEQPHRSEAITRIALGILERNQTAGLCLSIFADAELREDLDPEARKFCSKYLHVAVHAAAKKAGVKGH
ncbi:MAG: hypothetical protein AAF441_04105 [Pseudomonadota bacterium]